MESHDSPALRKKIRVVHFTQRKAGRILFKKKPKLQVSTRQTYFDEISPRASIS